MKIDDLKQRVAFVNNYPNVDRLLKNLGFRKGNLKETMQVDCYHYTDYPDMMYGVEKFVNDTLKINIVFGRGFDKYEYYLMGAGKNLYQTYTPESFFEFVTNQVRQEKENLLNQLNAISI